MTDHNKLRDFLGKREGLYQGEVSLKASDLNEAIAAAERLLGVHIYPGVQVQGDQKQCLAFAEDVVKVAQMLQKLSGAIVGGKPVDMGEVN
jgi:hypothetical protein